MDCVLLLDGEFTMSKEAQEIVDKDGTCVKPCPCGKPVVCPVVEVEYRSLRMKCSDGACANWIGIDYPGNILVGNGFFCGACDYWTAAPGTAEMRPYTPDKSQWGRMHYQNPPKPRRECEIPDYMQKRTDFVTNRCPMCGGGGPTEVPCARCDYAAYWKHWTKTKENGE